LRLQKLADQYAAAKPAFF